MSTSIVHLRVYRASSNGSRLSYDDKGKVQNENILVKLVHQTQEWRNYMKNIQSLGFIKAVVEKVVKEGKEIDIETFQAEVDKALNPVAETLTPDQKRIAELEDKLNAVLDSQSKKTKNPKKESKPVEDTDIELIGIRDEYEKIMGKKPFHGWSADELRVKMAEKQVE